MPDWLEFNTDMGKLEGKPTVRGDYTIIIRATDLVGAYTDYKFTIKIGISWIQLIFIIIGILSPLASAAGLLKHQ